jgi:hypothetical protein
MTAKKVVPFQHCAPSGLTSTQLDGMKQRLLHRRRMKQFFEDTLRQEYLIALARQPVIRNRNAEPDSR